MILAGAAAAKNIKNAAALNEISVRLISYVLWDMQYVPYEALAV